MEVFELGVSEAVVSHQLCQPVAEPPRAASTGFRGRASIVTGSAGRRLAGLCVLLLSLLIALPIPGTNTVLALTVFVIALGLIRGDGLLIAAGTVLTVVAAALMGSVTLALVGAVFGV